MSSVVQRDLTGRSLADLRLCLSGNEPHQAMLFAELKRQVPVVAEIAFEDIDLGTKILAAALSYARPRSEWWGNYQMHPLIQQRRRRVFQRELRRIHPAPDALLMWGSWFHPFAGRSGSIPFFTYIDQSRSLEPLPGEPPASRRRGVRAHAMQAATYRDACRVFCMSEWARVQTLQSHRDAVPPLEPKLRVVGWGPCAVDLSAEDLEGRPREPIVLHISNNFRRKGVDFLMATAARVAMSRPDVRFVVIGRDSSRLPLTPAANVTFCGPVYDKAALNDWFRRASLFFLPHRFDRSPHVLPEAMSAGLPIVTSAQGGPVELVQGTGVGYAVPVGDIDGYTRAVLGLLSDDRTRQATGACAKALMRSRYNWPAVARAMLTAISL